MKKMNNKGFMMAEVLAVTVVILTLFMAIYVNMMPTRGEYEKRLAYNDTTTQYRIFYLRKLLLNEEFSIPSNGYLKLYDGTSCINVSSSKQSTCTKLVKALKVEELILTNYKLTDTFKNSYTGVLKDYISYLPTYKKTDTVDDYSFTKCSSGNCETKNFYSKKVNGVWSDYTTTSCDVSDTSNCKMRVGYKETELYRLIVKTDHGYANTPLYVNLTNDNKGPVCTFTDPTVASILKGEKASFVLSCTDNSGFDTENITITTDSFTIIDSNSNEINDFSLVVSDPIYDDKNYAYNYDVVLQSSSDITSDISVKIRLKQGQISDSYTNTNTSSDSGFIIVKVE